MGYYTNYELRCENGAPFSAKELDAIEQMGELPNIDEFVCSGFTKWYSAEEDMRALSLKFPWTLFVLEGRGESADDIWRWFVGKGKIQKTRGEIVFPDFDEEKMQ